MYVNISGYKFIQLEQLETLKVFFKKLLLDNQLHGTIYVSHEGVNIAVTGLAPAITQFKSALAQDVRFNDIFFKDSLSAIRPFHKVIVKIKPEIIAMGVSDINVHAAQDSHLAPEVLAEWLDTGKEVVILDTRNDYEYEMGSFDNAINPDIETFKQFPEYVATLPENYKEKTIVIFCTGGVRCEKAAPFMLEQGFKQVYQLEGGILNYFEKCGGKHWHGNCFVFDDRLAIDSNLQETMK